MKGLYFLTVVTERDYGNLFLNFFRENGATTVFSELAEGTASASTLNLLGLEKTEKIIFFLMIREDKIETVKRGLKNTLNISAVGNGIAVFIPADGIGGETALKYLTGEEGIRKGEKSCMEKPLSELVLIIAVADKGSSETIMEAARSAGASGGTTVRAKGTGEDITKFFGMSISTEKEMIYIVTKRELRDGIMRAIMEKAGKDSEAHGIVFSLPVESVLGIGGLE